MSESLVVNPLIEVNNPNYDINQNESEKRPSKSLEKVKTVSKVETPDQEVMNVPADFVDSPGSDSHCEIQSVIAEPPVPLESEADNIDGVTLHVDADGVTEDDSQTAEYRASINASNSFCDVDLASGDSVHFGDSSCEVETALTLGQKQPETEHSPSDTVASFVDSNKTQEEPSPDPATMPRRSSDASLGSMDSLSSAQRFALPVPSQGSDEGSVVAENSIKPKRKSKRKTPALIEFDEPKGKSPGKGRVYKDWQRASSKKKAKGTESASTDGETRQDSTESTTMMDLANGRASPQQTFIVHRPPKLPDNLTPPRSASPQRDRSPSRVPQPHGLGAEPNIKHLLEATKDVVKSRTKNFFGNLKKNLKETFKESMMTEPTHPAMRLPIMAELYEMHIPMDVPPPPKTEKVRNKQSKIPVVKEPLTEFMDLYTVTKATSKAIQNPAICYNKKKLRAELEKWVPHLNDALSTYHQGVYDKKLAEYIEMKKREKMPLRDVFMDSLESSSGNEAVDAPMVDQIDDPYHLVLGGGETKRNKSPVNYLYKDDVNTEDIFSVLHAPIKREIMDEVEEPEGQIVEDILPNTSVELDNPAPNSQLQKNGGSVSPVPEVTVDDSATIDFADFDLHLSKVIYVQDPFCLPKELHPQVSKLVLMCLELGICGRIREKMLPVLSDEHKNFLERQKDGDTEEVISWSESADQERSDVLVANSKNCVCSSSFHSNTKSESEIQSKFSTTSSCRNCSVLSDSVIFMRCYFHFLNIPNLKRFIDHCHGNQRVALWRGLVECLQVLAESSDPFTNVIRRNDLSQVFQSQHNQELIESPAVLSHVVKLFKRNPAKTLLLCADLHKVISPLDVLIMSQDSEDFQELYLSYLDRLLGVMSNTDAAREALIDHISQEREVQLAWLKCLLSGKTDKNQCECGMPLPLGHTAVWKRNSLIRSVMKASEPCDEIVHLCHQHGYWSGYLNCLQFVKKRNHYLEILVQLGDIKLLEKTIENERANFGQVDFTRLIALKQRQMRPGNNEGPSKEHEEGHKFEHLENWYCINCGQPLEMETKHTTGQNVSTGVDFSGLITWDNLTQLLLKYTGYSNALDLLLEADIQEGTLSVEFIKSCLLAIGANQLQGLLVQDLMERVDNYLWRRKPGYMAPELAYSVQKEGYSGDRSAAEDVFVDLQDHKKLRSRYLENPACHWGVNTELRSPCPCCSLPLTDTINQIESGLIFFSCGHVFHKYCVPQKLCALCLSKV